MGSVRVDWDGSGCGEELNEDDSGEDQDGSQKGAVPEMLMQDEKGGQACEDGFEGEENCGVSGR